MENKEARLTDALHLYRWLRSLLAKRVLAPFCLRSSANRNREFSSPLVTASSTVWKVSWRAQRRRTYTRKNRCVSRMSHQALVEREREREEGRFFEGLGVLELEAKPLTGMEMF